VSFIRVLVVASLQWFLDDFILIADLILELLPHEHRMAFNLTHPIIVPAHALATRQCEALESA
jgi:hypothetical protein